MSGDGGVGRVSGEYLADQAMPPDDARDREIRKDRMDDPDELVAIPVLARDLIQFVQVFSAEGEPLMRAVGVVDQQIADRVKKIVVEHLGVEEEKVTESASFIDDLGADSLDTVELVMAFEEEFGCEIPDDAAEKIVTVKDAVAFLQTTAS